MQGEMPEWFVKAFKKEVDSLPYGEEYRKGAQRLWDTIVEGYDREDYATGSPISQPEEWVSVRGEKHLISEFDK